ncbi:MAG: hypothetical protein ACI4GY_02590 [Acutalibacteraceae bacterium]
MNENITDNSNESTQEPEIVLEGMEKIVFDLLEEVKTICRENRIRFMLFGETAVSAVVNGKLRKPYALIAVSAKDFYPLIQAIEKNLPENRAIDYMGKAENYKSFSARYHDTSTTYIPLGQTKNYYACGYFVEIIVIRSFIPGIIKRNYLNVLEHGWEGTFKHKGTFNSVKYSFSKNLVKTMKYFIGSKKFGSFIFSQLCKNYSQCFGKNSYYFKRFNQRITTFNFNPLEQLKRTELYGEDYPVTQRFGEFATKSYSQNWKEAIQKPGKNFSGVILSDVIPFKEMIKKLENGNHSLDSFYSKFNKKKVYHSLFNKYDKIKNDVWAIAKMTNDRLTLAEYYKPLMPLIRKLRENGDYQRLQKIMKRNRLYVVKHLNQGRGFAVNRELFNLQLDLFRYEGKYEVAEKLKEITPKQYMKYPG